MTHNDFVVLVWISLIFGSAICALLWFIDDRLAEIKASIKKEPK